VAVSAADPKTVDVVFVAKGNRLLARDIHVRGVSGAKDPTHDPDASNKHEKNNDDARPGEYLHARVKYLGHQENDPFPGTTYDRSFLSFPNGGALVFMYSKSTSRDAF
jgi:hypothetical protein